MFTPGRVALRSWMFIYLGLIAAIALAGPPVEADDASVEAVPAPAMIVDSPLLRRDI